MEKIKVPTKSGYYDLHYASNGQFAPKDGGKVENENDENELLEYKKIFSNFDKKQSITTETFDDLFGGSEISLDDFLNNDLPEDLQNINDYDLEEYFDKIKAKFTPAARKNFNDFFDTLQKCKKEYKKLILDAFFTKKYCSISKVRHKQYDGYYWGGIDELVFDVDRDSIIGNSPKYGTFFHENGARAVDSMIGRKIRDSALHTIQGNASYNFKGSNGKTIYEALYYDAKKINWIALDNEIKESRLKEETNLKEKKDELQNKITIDKDNEELKEEFNKVTDELMDLKHKYVREWTAVSDMCSGLTKNKFGLGLPSVGSWHYTNYWMDNPANVSSEFFAEVFQGKTINKNSYENMKKYFPTAIKIFEEIIEQYSKE